ncbi:MAG: cytochrome c oxidase assembly protein [Actinobacteria bacterium]|nr:cytochrome c oxidase assembly protein [Actinomycetota bacterium]
MLTGALAHAVAPLHPDDLWRAWNLATPVLVGLVLIAWAYRRGVGRGQPSRGRMIAFWVGLAAIGVGLVSPLDALSSSLASAHMVQHVVLILVAAPLLAFAAPGAAVLRGTPLPARRAVGAGRRQAGLTYHRLRMLRHPITVWLLHVMTLWLWHAAVLYDAAVRQPALHALEHTMFLLTGILFWRVVVGARVAERPSYGGGIALVFTMALQSVFLSVLLTFAREPWYSVYDGTTGVWGLTQLADQQLAGVIMWVPAGAVYAVTGLVLLSSRGSGLGRVAPDKSVRLVRGDRDAFGVHGRSAEQRPAAIRTPGDLARAHESLQRGRRRRPVQAGELPEQFVRQRQWQDHALRSDPAPAVGEMPEQGEQARLRLPGLGDRELEDECTRALRAARQQRDHDARPAAEQAGEALVEDRQRRGLQHTPRACPVDEPGRLRFPRAQQVTAAEQLRAVPVVHADRPADEPVEDEQAEPVGQRGVCGGRRPRSDRELQPARHDAPTQHLRRVAVDGGQQVRVVPKDAHRVRPRGAPRPRAPEGLRVALRVHRISCSGSVPARSPAGRGPVWWQTTIRRRAIPHVQRSGPVPT